MKRLETSNISNWQPRLSRDEQHNLIQALENGLVINLPSLNFEISPLEKALFSSNLVTKDRKNVSYNPKDNSIKGFHGNNEAQKIMHGMMKRFADSASHFMELAFAHYKSHLEIARTSFRPVEIKGRQHASYKKDDSLLHIDSFPSSPTHGKRILRFFANVNPFNRPRVWRIGEPYKNVVKRFLPQIRKPVFGLRTLMHRFGITKSYRILYDHYMLHIHDRMKADHFYQKNVDQETIEFGAQTCWIAFTDQVSHSALAGQYVLEQSFYLPADAQLNPDKSPIHYMEKLAQKSLRN